jgi:hypothetical protein
MASDPDRNEKYYINSGPSLEDRSLIGRRSRPRSTCEAVAPVTRATAMVCDRDDPDQVGIDRIDQREAELAEHLLAKSLRASDRGSGLRMIEDERDTSVHVVIEVASHERVDTQKPIEFGEVLGLGSWVKLDATS